jgi:YceI-like domain
MRIFLTTWCVLVFFVTSAQTRYYAERSRITFFSDGVVEDIRANNGSVTSIFDVTKKEIAFLLKVKDFQFDKKLMQVHFNEKYLEAEKFPKSTFVGQVTGYDTDKSGSQKVTASGKLFIHGVTREVQIPGTIEKKGRNLMLRSKFMIKLADYKISIPQIIWQNVAEEVEVDIDFMYTPL